MIETYVKDKYFDSTLILVGKFIEEFSGSNKWVDSWFSYNCWINNFLSPQYKHFVYQKDNSVKGLILGKASSKEDFEISFNDVIKEFRSRGIGNALKNTIENYADYNHYKRIHSGCYKDNIHSLNMQYSNNYVVESEDDEYISFYKELSWHTTREKPLL